MDIKEFYNKIGSDSADVEKRLGSLSTAEYFVKKFASDKTYPMLKEAYEAGDNEKAFRTAHTLKGLCSNLGFAALFSASSALTEALRGGKPIAGTASLYAEVKKEYDKLIAAMQ